MSAPAGAAAPGAAAMTDDEVREWRQSLRRRSAEVLRRRQERAVVARRRAHGLIDRRAARLAGPLPPGYEPGLDCTE